MTDKIHVCLLWHVIKRRNGKLVDYNRLFPDPWRSGSRGTTGICRNFDTGSPQNVARRLMTSGERVFFVYYGDLEGNRFISGLLELKRHFESHADHAEKSGAPDAPNNLFLAEGKMPGSVEQEGYCDRLGNAFLEGTWSDAVPETGVLVGSTRKGRDAFSKRFGNMRCPRGKWVEFSSEKELLSWIASYSE